MYRVIDTCYGQNLSLVDNSSETKTIQDIASTIHDCNVQLKQWQHELVPSLGFHILQEPLKAADIDVMQIESVIFHRFNVVLSLRFHNLRVLLHRKFLERLLSNFYSGKPMAPQEAEINSMSECVESAMIIISTVHTIATTTGWHRGLLGAWNYSLYYSKLPSLSSLVEVDLPKLQPSTPD